MNRAQLQRQAIEISYGKQQRTTSLFRAGRLRLYQWGAAIRTVIILQGPSQSPSRSTAYSLSGRAGYDDVFRDLVSKSIFQNAVETDHWLDPIREDSPTAFSAATIRYVQRDLDGAPLSSDEQVRRFHKFTGLGRQTYYTRIDYVLQFICAEILEAENPDLKRTGTG